MRKEQLERSQHLNNAQTTTHVNNNMTKYRRDNVEHAHMRIDDLEEGNIKTKERVKTTEETVETLLQTLVASDIRKENNKNWLKWVSIGLFSVYIISKVGLIEAVKIWIGLI